MSDKIKVCKECVRYESECFTFVSPEESFPEIEGGCQGFMPRLDYEKDIYRWRMGRDDEDLRFLTALNTAIDLMFSLDDFAYYSHQMNVSSHYTELIEQIIEKLDVAEIAFQLEVIRTLLIGGKVRYEFLQEVLKRGLPLHGYVKKEIKEDGENDESTM